MASTSRIGTAVDELVLLPGLAHKHSHLMEVGPLNSLIHIHGVLFHFAEQTDFIALIEEHAAHDLGQYLFGCARDTRII